MRGEQFFRQAQAALKTIQLGFRSISHTSQLRLYRRPRAPLETRPNRNSPPG